MEYTLIALVVLIGLALVLGHRYHSRTWSGRPGYLYQRVISVGVIGLWLTVAGAIGWDLTYVRGLFEGTRWVDGPVWWQIGLGLPLVALALFLAWRVPANATRSPVLQ